MQQVENSPADDEDRLAVTAQYLTFMLGGKTYGLEVVNIKEIIEYGEISEIPMTPDFISGVINLRGSVVPIVDLSQRFSGESTKLTKRTSIVILDVNSNDLKIQIGVTVDQVNEVIDIDPKDIGPPPSFGDQIQTKFIASMAKIEGKLLILLDINNVLSIDDISVISSIEQDLVPE